MPSLGELRRNSQNSNTGAQGSPHGAPGDPWKTAPGLPKYAILVGGFAVIAYVFWGVYLRLAIISPLGGWLCVLGVLFLLVGHVLLAAETYSENLALSIAILWLPVIGPLFAIPYISTHLAATRWPLICIITGVLLAIVAIAGVR